MTAWCQVRASKAGSSKLKNTAVSCLVWKRGGERGRGREEGGGRKKGRRGEEEGGRKKGREGDSAQVSVHYSPRGPW